MVHVNLDNIIMMYTNNVYRRNRSRVALGIMYSFTE